MNGKNILQEYDRDKSRFAEHLAILKANEKSLNNTITKCRAKLPAITEEITAIESMELSEFVKVHPDTNYTGPMKNKKAGVDLKL